MKRIEPSTLVSKRTNLRTLESIQESAVDILKKQESKVRLTLTKQDSGRAGVINELLSWNDGNIQKLLNSLDVPDNATRLDDYEEVRERMDKLWGDAIRYKQLSHAEMEEVLDAFSDDSLTPAMLEEIANNEDFKLAIQKAAMNRIPKQVQKLYGSIAVLIDSMRKGRAPTKEEEDQIFNEAHLVNALCSKIQTVLTDAPSISTFNNHQQREVDAMRTSIDLPRSRRSSNDYSPAARKDSSATSTQGNRFKAMRTTAAADNKYVLDKEDSASAHSMSPEASAERVDSTRSGPINTALNPKPVIAPAPPVKKPVERKAPCVSMGTQTDLIVTDPIVQLSGQQMKGVDFNDIRKYRGRVRNMSVSSTGSATSVSSSSTLDSQVATAAALLQTSPKGHAAVEHKKRASMKSDPAKKGEVAKDTERTELKTDISDGSPVKKDSPPKPHKAVADEVFPAKQVGAKRNSLVAPAVASTAVASKSVTHKAATGEDVITKSLNGATTSEVTNILAGTTAARAVSPKLTRRTSLKNSLADEMKVEGLISQLMVPGAISAIDEENVQHLLTPENIIAIHNHFLVKIEELEAKQKQLQAKPATGASTGTTKAKHATPKRASTTLTAASEPLLTAIPEVSIDAPLPITDEEGSVAPATEAPMRAMTPDRSESAHHALKRASSSATLTRKDDNWKPKGPRRNSLDTSITNIEFEAPVRIPSGEVSAPVAVVHVPIEAPVAPEVTAPAPVDSAVKAVTFKAPPVVLPVKTAAEVASSAVTKLPELLVSMIKIPAPVKVDRGVQSDLVAESAPKTSAKDESIENFVLNSKRIPLKSVVARESFNDSMPLSETRNSSPETGYFSDNTEVDVKLDPPEFSLGLIEAKLKQSLNPLFDLHQLFGELIPSDFSVRLLKASIDDDALSRQSSLVSNIFTSLKYELVQLQETSIAITQKFGQCELAAAAVYQASTLKPEQGLSILVSTTAELYRVLGDVEVEVMIFDVNLLETRTVFEKLNVQGAAVLPNLVKTNKEFAETYALFTHCQSKSQEFKKKLNMVYDFTAKFKLDSLQVSHAKKSNLDETKFTALSNSVEELTQENLELTESLEVAKSEIHRLELELFEIAQTKDRTPSALLFFVALNDMTTTENLQQLSIQLKKLREFAECKVHMDFVDLRKRLHVCLTCIPYIDRFLSNFNNLHRQWTKKRLAVFEKRSVINSRDEDLSLAGLSLDATMQSMGGGADGFKVTGQSKELNAVKSSKRLL